MENNECNEWRGKPIDEEMFDLLCRTFEDVVTDDNGFAYGQLEVDSEADAENNTSIILNVEYHGQYENVYVPVFPNTVCKSMDKCDIHGKTIFEGDIVKYANAVDFQDVHSDFQGVGIVGFTNDLPCVRTKDHTNYQWSSCVYEIIDSIFDNPEIMEEYGLDKMVVLDEDIDTQDTETSSQKKLGEGVGFERIRRITGYLVGTLDNFNDAKRAEVNDRVKHSLSKEWENADYNKQNQ